MTPDRRFRPSLGDYFVVQWHTAPGQAPVAYGTTCVWQCAARQDHFVVGAWVAGEVGYRHVRPVFNFDLVRFHAVRPETLAAAMGADPGAVHAGRVALEVAR